MSPITGLTEADYVQHHEPFQFYASTRPTPARAPDERGEHRLAGDAANHQYDIHDFFDSLNAGNLAAVSYLKAPSYQNAHPGNSNPLDEQAFVVNVINTLMQSPFWNSTAVIIAYDDSDGWYDHQQGTDRQRFVLDRGYPLRNQCLRDGRNHAAAARSELRPALPVNGRCSSGVRTPLLVISPWAKPTMSITPSPIQTSILRFIEDNWNLGRIGGGSFDAHRESDHRHV